MPGVDVCHALAKKFVRCGIAVDAVDYISGE
jgi:hypothetical protein